GGTAPRAICGSGRGIRSPERIYSGILRFPNIKGTRLRSHPGTAEEALVLIIQRAGRDLR
ncbi:hypothetical protein KI387_043329, partial [Taxus chinensis]